MNGELTNKGIKLKYKDTNIILQDIDDVWFNALTDEIITDYNRNKIKK